MKQKTWIMKIDACGISQVEAAIKARELINTMVSGRHTRGYTIGDINGNAVGNWEEGPEVEDGNHA